MRANMRVAVQALSLSIYVFKMWVLAFGALEAANETEWGAGYNFPYLIAKKITTTGN